MQISLHSVDLTLVLQEGKAWTDGLITPEDLIIFIVVFREKKGGGEMCLVQTLNGQICQVYSPSGWGAYPALSSCLSLSDTSENSKDSRWNCGVSNNLNCKDGWSGVEEWNRDNSIKQVQACGSDLGCEQALLVIQTLTCVTLQGFLKGLSSGGPQKGQESAYLVILHTSATTVTERQRQ